MPTDNILMRTRNSRIWLVSAISISRLLVALLFASVAFHVSRGLVAGVYVVAMGSDVIDGYFARRLKVETDFGKVLDLISDKSLTIVSLLFAAIRGVGILPLALIATREIIGLGVRMIMFDGSSLLPTNRTLGRLMVIAVWGNTLFLILAGEVASLIRVANLIYWCCAIILTFSFLVRVVRNLRRLRMFLAHLP
jgi:phosphatidylglycerophosphate synthase